MSVTINNVKRRPRWGVIIPLLLVLCLIVYLLLQGIGWVLNLGSGTSFKACDGFGNGSVVSKIKKSTFENVTSVGDYFFYGESLVLTSQPYQKLSTTNDFVGSQLVLVNTCNKKEVVIEPNGKLDQFIELGKLDNGFYEIYVQQGDVRSRLYSDKLIEAQMYTVLRAGQRKSVQLLANPVLLDQAETQTPSLDRGYLFLKVAKGEVPETVLDIMLDPGHNSNDLGEWIEKGSSENGIVEADELHRFAVDVQTKLTKAGFRVGVTRDLAEVLNTYGIDGRINRTIDAQAKYYIELQMVGIDDKTASGTTVWYSSYASNTFADAVLQGVLKDTGLTNSGIMGDGEVPGVAPVPRYDGFDGSMTIREVGGIALQAARYSSKAENENGAFARTVYGVQGITIEYIYATNANDVAKWNTGYDKLVEATAQAIINYFK